MLYCETVPGQPPICHIFNAYILSFITREYENIPWLCDMTTVCSLQEKLALHYKLINMSFIDLGMGMSWGWELWMACMYDWQLLTWWFWHKVSLWNPNAKTTKWRILLCNSVSDLWVLDLYDKFPCYSVETLPIEYSWQYSVAFIPLKVMYSWYKTA